MSGEQASGLCLLAASLQELAEPDSEGDEQPRLEGSIPPLETRHNGGTYMPPISKARIDPQLVSKAYKKLAHRFRQELRQEFVFGEKWVEAKMRACPDGDWENPTVFDDNLDDIYTAAKNRAAKVAFAPSKRPGHSRPLSESWAAAAFATVSSPGLRDAVLHARLCLWEQEEPVAAVSNSEPEAIERAWLWIKEASATPATPGSTPRIDWRHPETGLPPVLTEAGSPAGQSGPCEPACATPAAPNAFEVASKPASAPPVNPRTSDPRHHHARQTRLKMRNASGLVMSHWAPPGSLAAAAWARAESVATISLWWRQD